MSYCPTFCDVNYAPCEYVENYKGYEIWTCYEAYFDPNRGILHRPIYYEKTHAYDSARHTIEEVRAWIDENLSPISYSNVTITITGQGTTEPPAGNYPDTYLIGEKLYVSAYPSAGWRYKHMKRNGAVWTEANPGEFSNLTETENIEVVFESETQPQPPSLCFIATAAYGSPLAPQLEVLRKFRDCYLPDMLVNFYYKVSPPIAKAISANNKIKRITRKALDITIKLLNCKF
jgi:hypothetical protein